MSAAKGVVEGLGRMRLDFPDFSDERLLVIARAIGESNGASVEVKGKKTLDDPGLPPTLAAGMREVILESGGQVRTGELVRAIEFRGWSHLSDGTDLYGLVGRTLQSDPQFISPVRGTWRLADHTKADDPRFQKVEPPPDPNEAPLNFEKLIAQETEEEKIDVLSILRRKKKSMLAKDIAAKMGKDVFWVVARLKKLHEEGSVRVVKKLTNGTAMWGLSS